jgi:hypothetical protein
MFGRIDGRLYLKTNKITIMTTFKIETNDFFGTHTYCNDGKFRNHAYHGSFRECIKTYRKFENAVKVAKKMIDRGIVKQTIIVEA